MWSKIFVITIFVGVCTAAAVSLEKVEEEKPVPAATIEDLKTDESNRRQFGGYGFGFGGFGGYGGYAYPSGGFAGYGGYGGSWGGGHHHGGGYGGYGGSFGYPHGGGYGHHHHHG